MKVTVISRYSDYDRLKYFNNVDHIEHTMSTFILVLEDGKRVEFEYDHFEFFDETKV